MWQKKEKNSRESISIEEYLIRRKNKRVKDEADAGGSLKIDGENGSWMLAEIYM